MVVRKLGVTMSIEFTRVPNYFFEHMADMDKCEQSVVLLIIRKTIGYQKEWDRISFSQFQEASGAKHPLSIQRGIEASIARGIVQRRQTKNSYEYRVCEPTKNASLSEVILGNEVTENDSESEVIFTSESESISEITSLSEPKSLHKVKTQKKKENKNNNTSDDAQNSEQKEWFSAMCWLVYGHKDYNLLSKIDKIAVGKTIKDIRASPNEYTITDLRTWYRDKWSTNFPGKQTGKTEIQRPSLKQIKTGIGQVKAKADNTNGFVNQFEVNKSIAVVGELER